MTHQTKSRLSFMMLIVVVVSAWTLTSAPVPLGTGGFAAQAQSRFAFQHTADEVMVKLKSSVNAKQFAQRYRLTPKRQVRSNVFLFGISNTIGQSVEDTTDLLSKDRDVVWAEPNFWMQLDQSGDDEPVADQRNMAGVDQRNIAFVDGQSPSDYYSQYAMDKIQATQAHAYSTGQGVWVAVIDTGVDITHPAINATLQGRDFVNNDWDASETGSGPAYGHGTHVAGTVNLVAPDAQIMPIRAFNSNGNGSTSNIASAIYYAVDNGAQVINMSFSMASSSWTVHEAIEYANNWGVVLVSTAGNNGDSLPRYPANYTGVIGVAATDQDDRRADFSNYGAAVDVSAPGVGIYSAYPGGGWAWWDGTSFAAPMVSGEAALLLAQGRSTSRITSTAVPLVNSGMGSGRINCLAAVSP